ncbi:MAG: DUF4150 domain-containing protein [Polyangiaceae bacterium]|nr:DUF4150 domain-containing protein [Polyangiaceae bacterium]
MRFENGDNERMGSVTALMMDVITEKSGHQMVGMAVSVCLTPAAPSPLPIPYPTFASVGEGVIDECLRTKIDGAKVLTVGSCTKNCHGNEPGTLKEVVSLNTTGPSFPILGAPIVFIELGMAGITLSPGFMNKNPIPGIGGSASGAGGGGGGGGGAGGGGGGPGGSNTKGPNNGSGGGGGNNSGAAPPNAPAAPGADGQASGGHPVDVVTGTMFTIPTVDFETRGPLPMFWVRSYRTSAVLQNIGLGHGWSHSFAWRAEVSQGQITITDSEGSPFTVPIMADGETAIGTFGRTVRLEGDLLVIATRDGAERVLRRHDDKIYRMVEMRDGNGNITEVVWEDGEVTQLTDCVGRRAECQRSVNRRVWQVVYTDESGKEHRTFAVSYEFDERGDLVRVIDAGGAATEFAYDDATENAAALKHGVSCRVVIFSPSFRAEFLTIPLAQKAFIIPSFLTFPISSKPL